MCAAKTSDTNGSSKVDGDADEDTFSAVTPEDVIYEFFPKKKKRKKIPLLDPEMESEIIDELKPKARLTDLEAMYEKGDILKKVDAVPIYGRDQEEKKERPLYLYDDEDVIYETIYESVESKNETVYAKGKERNKETTISSSEKEEHVGRYSDMEVDYALDESPYHEVYLEEIVTEGKPTQPASQEKKEGKGEAEKRVRKRKNKAQKEEQGADIEEILFEDDD